MAYINNIEGRELEPMTPTLNNKGGIYADSLESTTGMVEVKVASNGKAYVPEIDISGKEDKTTITTNTTDTTITLTLADNNEYRYTQDLSSLNLTMPQGDFISSVIFASGSTATSMTYDSSIKWSGDDITSNAFVPQINKTYNLVFWFDGININGIARGV